LYQAIIGPFADTHHYEMRRAQLPRSATAFSAPEHVEDQHDNTHSPSTPGLAMANGKVYTRARVRPPALTSRLREPKT